MNDDVTLKSGTIVNTQNVDNLSLLDAVDLDTNHSASKYDVFKIRKNMHDLIDKLNPIFGMTELFVEHMDETNKSLKEISKSLKITVKNGKEEEKTLAQVILDDREALKVFRKTGKFINAAADVKVLIIILVTVLMSFAVNYNKSILEFIKSIL
ncbi:MAG: hypothetical protein ABIJ97_08900 [Bacteroidota bacterium]